ncbi:Leucine aminopeptidase 1 [Chytridiales sp. JEL 0842]|nr:Leucine aminopeptidase 1 [Chytridiales sp. JEL 0842]
MHLLKLTTAALLLALSASSVSALRTPPANLHSRHEADSAKIMVAATKGPPAPVAIPAGPQYQNVVNELIGRISTPKLTQWATTLTEFPDRYYKSQNGVKAVKWIADQARALKSAPGTKVTVSLFEHSWRVQPSAIIRYEATTPNDLRGIVITGSHIDTVGSGSGKPEPNANPAADDCASGSTVVFETLRVLVDSGFVPGRPIEFHFYAGEEVGIYGSNEIAEAYAKNKTEVVSYLNLDQSGYVKKGTKATMGIATDYTTKSSTSFLRNVVRAYAGRPQGDTRCGYACTDNSAWYSHGYESAMAFESLMENAFPYNDRVKSDGSPLDTLDVLDWDHITAFAKNTLGFVVELSLAGSGRANGRR